MKKVFSLVIISSLFSPSLAFAQEGTTTQPVETTIQEVVETEISEPTPTSTEVPEVQETISSELIEETANPQDEMDLEEAIEIIDEATEERLEDEILIEATSTEEVIEIPVEEEEIIEVIETATTTEVAVLEEEVLIPKKEYTFDISAASIATNENPDWTQDPNEKDPGDSITNIPNLNPNVEPNTLQISGVCTEPYFVILLYKNEGDYNTNPSSYIYNKAYSCVGGQYSYSLSELPFNLESDTFYLLVGGQGERGSWKPMSALIPVGITVTTTFVNASGTPVDIEDIIENAENRKEENESDE